MDPFKLLTKGTKLNKANTANPNSFVMPSSGPAKDPQTLVARDWSMLPEDIHRGVKRKRANATRTEKPISSGSTQAPDFFNVGLGKQTQVSSVKPTLETLAVKSQVVLEETPYRPQTEEECKQILRRHKLKITLMNPAKSKSREPKDKKSSLVQLTPQPCNSFGELRLRFKISQRLAANLDDQGYSTPTEVQLAAIPILLGNDEDRGLPASKSKKVTRSHVDLISIAPTGSGKTLAFLIPIIQGLLDLKHRETDDNAVTDPHVKAIILAPTHELADQIVNEARKLTHGTRLRVAGMRKGMQILPATSSKSSNNKQDASVKVDILVSTPLALLNAILDGSTEPEPLPSVHYLVLDEADVLLDPLFREQSLSIWKACTNGSLQVSLWSATIGASIEHLAQEFITSRRKQLELSRKHHYIIRLIAGLKDSSLPTISHRLTYAATEQGKLLAIRQILHPTTATIGPTLRPPFLIFTQTIPRASALHSELLYDIPIEAGGSSRIAVLHSSLSDTARSDIMARFRKGEVWILITTDLLSRGVDFRGVNGIVNYDIPTTSAAYVHRAGRTGRAGRGGGLAITLYTKEDIPYVKNVANVIAASERVHGKKSEIANGDGVPKWLLNALPDVSKKAKKDLKTRGVEERRAGAEGSKARISTKSGFQRQEENRKKGAMVASKGRKLGAVIDERSGSESEWAGLDD